MSGDSEGSSGRAEVEGQESGENWKARLKAEASPLTPWDITWGRGFWLSGARGKDPLPLETVLESERDGEKHNYCSLRQADAGCH